MVAMYIRLRPRACQNGYFLELNREQETIRVCAKNGDTLTTVSWRSVIELMDPPMIPDRQSQSRSHPRAPLTVPIRYGESSVPQQKGMTANMGAGGVFIETIHPLPKHKIIQLELTLPDSLGITLSAEGRVSWTRLEAERHLLFPGMGIEFVEIAEEARARLLRLIDMLNRFRR
jgi:type IV pilus assembly protein PilZ